MSGTMDALNFRRLVRRQVGLAIFALVMLIPSSEVKGKTPPWMLGLPSFTGKSPAQEAQEGPAFAFPVPSDSVVSDVAGPNAVIAQASPTAPSIPADTVTEAERVAPVEYVIGEAPGNALSALALPEMEMPPEALAPPLPSPAAVALPDVAVPDVAVPDVAVPEATMPEVTLPEVALPAVPTADGEIPSAPIGKALAEGGTGEAPPLVETTTSWYHTPWNWISRGWKNHAEFGLDGSSGNASTLALQTGIELTRKTDRYTLGLDFDYRKATNAGVTTEDNGRFDINYDHLFQDSKWSAFGKFGSEWDQFKAFDSRINLNGGVGYHFVRTDDALLATRFGAGGSKEIGAPDDDWKPEAVFGAEAEYQLNRYNKMKAKVDYFPAWEDFSDFRVVTDAAWEILLDDSDNLSLKLAVTDRYDSTPQGAEPNDLYYSLLLLVKF